MDPLAGLHLEPELKPLQELSPELKPLQELSPANGTLNTVDLKLRSYYYKYIFPFDNLGSGKKGKKKDPSKSRSARARDGEREAMEGSRAANKRDPFSNREVWSIAEQLDVDPEAAAPRYARMGQKERELIQQLRSVWVAMDRACGMSRKAVPGRRISYRLERGRIVRETPDGEQKLQEVPTDGGGVGQGASPSSSAGAAVPRSEDDLCSAFGSARF